MPTDDAEALGSTGGSTFKDMGFTIEKATVTAKSRALQADYSLELAQDLKAIHGLDAETELANILTTEILAEINREVVRTINSQAKTGCLQGNTAINGIFNLSTDADGRWSAEKFKGMVVQIEREANVIAKETRRGKGNFILCSSDVASVLAASGMLDYTPEMNAKLNVDDTGNTFAGMLNGRTKVFIDQYIHILIPLLIISTLDIKALTLMMLVYSIAHTCRLLWYVRLWKLPSNQKSGSKLVTVWYPTHSLVRHLLMALRLLSPINITDYSGWIISLAHKP